MQFMCHITYTTCTAFVIYDKCSTNAPHTNTSLHSPSDTHTTHTHRPTTKTYHTTRKLFEGQHLELFKNFERHKIEEPTTSPCHLLGTYISNEAHMVDTMAWWMALFFCSTPSLYCHCSTSNSFPSYSLFSSCLTWRHSLMARQFSPCNLHVGFLHSLMTCSLKTFTKYSWTPSEAHVSLLDIPGWIFLSSRASSWGWRQVMME